MVVIYHEYVVLLDNIGVCYWCSLLRQFFTSGLDAASWNIDVRRYSTGWSAKKYRYTRWGDATDSVTEWLLGEQYIYVLTSCVTYVRPAEWSSIGSANRGFIAQAQRVSSIQFLFIRVLAFLSDVFGSVFEYGLNLSPAFIYLS
jgi:hypothetical protein